MDIQAIKELIKEDKERVTSSYRRYPVRFLFMELSHDTQNDIKELVDSCGGELLDLSDYIMRKNDGWMTKNRFLHVIGEKVSNDKDTFVVGFSELIRFFSKKEIESTVLSLFDIENSGAASVDKRRIYFICFSMVDDVYKVLQNSFHRSNLLDPFLNTEFDYSIGNRKICFVSSEYSEHIKVNKITSSVEWLGLWRHAEIIDYRFPIWCCSESLFAWHQKASPDNAFQIDVVTNDKEYLQKAFGVELGLQYKAEDSSHWKQLIGVCDKAPSLLGFKDIAASILSVDVNSIEKLAAKMVTTDASFHRWLVSGLVFTYYPETVLGRVLQLVKTHSNKEFIKAIWQYGYWNQNEELLKERLLIINELRKYANYSTPEADINRSIATGIVERLDHVIDEKDVADGFMVSEWCQMSNAEEATIVKRLEEYYYQVFKPAFTGVSSSEKEYIIAFYSNGVIDDTEVEAVYPAFYTYLFGEGENQIDGHDDIKTYLHAYRMSKVFNKDTAFLQNYYSSGAANSSALFSMYYSLPKQDVALSPYVESSRVYILDGVGAEYMPFLISAVKQNGYSIDYCDYASCHLPSITEVNKKYLASTNYIEWFLDFDRDVIHGEYYKPTANLQKALALLENKVRDIISESSGQRIAICADHGATARAKWVGGKKKYDFSNSDHEGRCCRIDSIANYDNTEDYIAFEDEGDSSIAYLISLNETSLYNRPKYEDHGGATIEEMIVPVIVASPQTYDSQKDYSIIDNKLIVSGLDKSVSFIITPAPENEVYLIESDLTEHEMEQQDGVFYAYLNSGKEQDVWIKVNGIKKKFRTINKSKKNMEGDDGFDD